MAYKKIVVTQTQSLVIQRLLKADKGNTPVQDLIDSIVAESSVEEWVAKKFADAWRWNHRNDNNTEPDQAKQQQQQEEYFVRQPLPFKTTADPAKGTGIVAQIIALAEQGKTTQQMIELGYNKSTVYRQVSEWKKRKKLAQA